MRALVTYGWCRTSYVICESLVRAGFRVSACGDSALCMTRVSRYVDTFDRSPNPFQQPRAYAAAVGEIAKRRGAAIVIPAHEDFIPLREFGSLLPAEVVIAAPSWMDGVEALDKWKLLQRAEAAGVTIPKTYAPVSNAEAEEILTQAAAPLILKPRRGNGGKGVVLVQKAGDAVPEYRRLVRRFGLEPPSLPLIQQYVTGTPLGSCFIAVNGELAACFVERYLRCKQAGLGTSVFREAAEDDDLRRATGRLCKELNWTGVGHLDFIASPCRSRAYLLEMNPRFWGALNLSVQGGYDFPRAMASLAISGTFSPACFSPRPATRSLWIAGELMACLDDLRHGRWLDALRSPVRFLQSRCFDDFRLGDPVPLLLELAYYLTAFLRSGGDLNPATSGMINPQHEAVSGPASY